MTLDFDEADFCVPEDGHPDEVSLSVSGNTTSSETKPDATAVSRPMPPPARPVAGNLGNGANTRPPQTPNQSAQRQVSVSANNQTRPPPQNQQLPPRVPFGAAQSGARNVQTPPPQTTGAPEPLAFFSARALSQLPPDASTSSSVDTQLPIPQGVQAFNPKAESPSIRKTPGIDHSKSKPVARNGQHVSPSSSQQGSGGAARPSAPQQAGRGNLVNPQFDHARRIGAPGGVGSPLSNRSQYRPPTIKRPIQTDPNNGGRSPLIDVNSNLPINVVSDTAGPDIKRQKTG
jgi:DNA repair and recombination protein RAD52